VEANVREAPFPILELLGLLVSEVVTNAIVHAQTSLVVTVKVRGQAIRVEVHDDSPSLPVLVQAASHEAGGRGMAILDRLADDWGVYTEPLDGKTVWFEVGLSGL
jgi:anti-sigma regulatory factor (Ser/Thr protein kinase)